jgi:hypothetical protein
MNISPPTYTACHAALKKGGAVLLVLLMLSVTAGAQAAPPSADCSTWTFGDFTFLSTATHVADIAGLVPCDEHDQFTVDDTLDLNSATLEIVLFNDFVPVLGDRFDILNWGTLIGTFGTIDAGGAILQAPLVWDTSQLYLTGELVVDVQHFEDGDLAPWDDPDGKIDAADVLIAQQLVLGRRTPGALQYAHGDMNGDCIIDTADLLLITQAVLTP